MLSLEVRNTIRLRSGGKRKIYIFVHIHIIRGGEGMGYRWRWMYRLTGLLGWLRFGFSPGWLGRSPYGLPPTAYWLISSGLLPYYLQYLSTMAPMWSWWAYPTTQTATMPTQAASTPTYPAFSTAPGFPPMSKEEEKAMLEEQMKMLQEQIEAIRKRIRELESE